MSIYLRVLARFVHAADKTPITGSDYLVRLMDKDVLVDDELSAKRPDANGSVELGFHVSDMDSPDSPLETEPDLYLVLLRGDITVHSTPVMMNVDFLSENPHSGIRNKLTRDLGTIVV